MQLAKICAIIIFVASRTLYGFMGRCKRWTFDKRRLDVRLFVYCSDPRKEADLENKVNQKLLHPGEKIARITLYGGPVPLAHPADLRDEAACLLKQIRFSMKLPVPFAVTEVVLVFHNCGYYANVSRLVNKRAKQNDVVTAMRFLRKHIHGIKIRAYYDNSNGDNIHFIRYRRQLARAH